MLRGATSWGGGHEVVAVDPLVLDDLKLLLETYARWTRVFGAAKSE